MCCLAETFMITTLCCAQGSLAYTDPTLDLMPDRVAAKIFEGFGEALLNGFIIDQEPVSIVHYTRPGTCINRPLH